MNEEEKRPLNQGECAQILGGTIGTLAQMTTLSTVREAVIEWAQDDVAWSALETQLSAYREAMENANG